MSSKRNSTARRKAAKTLILGAPKRRAPKRRRGGFWRALGVFLLAFKEGRKALKPTPNRQTKGAPKGAPKPGGRGTTSTRSPKPGRSGGGWSPVDARPVDSLRRAGTTPDGWEVETVRPSWLGGPRAAGIDPFEPGEQWPAEGEPGDQVDDQDQAAGYSPWDKPRVGEFASEAEFNAALAAGRDGDPSSAAGGAV